VTDGVGVLGLRIDPEGITHSPHLDASVGGCVRRAEGVYRVGDVIGADTERRSDVLRSNGLGRRE
jgi:hypothetical protein